MTLVMIQKVFQYQTPCKAEPGCGFSGERGNTSQNTSRLLAKPCTKASAAWQESLDISKPEYKPCFQRVTKVEAACEVA